MNAAIQIEREVSEHMRETITLPDGKGDVMFAEIAKHPHLWKPTIDRLIAQEHPLAALMTKLLAMKARLPYEMFPEKDSTQPH